MAATVTEMMCRNDSVLQTPLTYCPFSIDVDIGRSSSARWFQSDAVSSRNRCSSSSRLSTTERSSHVAVVSKQDDVDRSGLISDVETDGDHTCEHVRRKKSDILLERYQLYTIAEEVYHAVANGRGYSSLLPKLQSLSVTAKRIIYDIVFEVMHCKFNILRQQQRATIYTLLPLTVCRSLHGRRNDT